MNLVNSEIISYRAGGNITMLKEKLIPALIGLLWTGTLLQFIETKTCMVSSITS